MEAVGSAGSRYGLGLRQLVIGLDLKPAAISLDCLVSFVDHSPQNYCLLTHRVLQSS